MTEIRTIIPEEIDRYLESLVRTGPFGTKAELVRAAIVSFANQIGPLAKEFDKENIFSPDGRIYQIEYARESSLRGSPIAGVVAVDGVVLAAEWLQSSWIHGKMVGKIACVGPHVALTGIGLIGDLAAVIRLARKSAAKSAEEFLDEIKTYFWEHTVFRDRRPLGVTLFVATTFDGEPRLFHVDPSSSAIEVDYDVFGDGRERGLALLEKGYRRGKPKEAEDLALRALGNPKKREVLYLPIRG